MFALTLCRNQNIRATNDDYFLSNASDWVHASISNPIFSGFLTESKHHSRSRMKVLPKMKICIILNLRFTIIKIRLQSDTMCLSGADLAHKRNCDPVNDALWKLKKFNTIYRWSESEYSHSTEGLVWHVQMLKSFLAETKIISFA